MANVTQQIPNYLGGVSRIPDFNKQPGQVRNLTNGYPDLTYGLLKRPGSEYLYTLDDFQEDENENVINNIVVNACYHVIDREGDPTFMVVLYQNFIKVFNLHTGVEVEVDVENDLQYLAFDNSAGIPRKNQFDFVSDDRRTIIVNRTRVVEPYPNTTHGFQWANEKYRTAGNIGELPDSSAKTVSLTAVTYTNPLPSLTAGVHILPTRLNDTDVARDSKASGLTVRVVIKNDGTIDETQDVTIVSAGYNYYNEQPVKIIGTNSIINVTTGLQCGFVYHVTGPTGNGNNTDKSDDYYMTPFSSRVDLVDTFFWVEIVQPDARAGLFKGHLPHELVYDKDENKFKYRVVDYSWRWCGNEYTNPDPSFVNKRIDSAFFFNNRLGFLSDDNVIMSRPIVYTDVLDPDAAQDIVTPDGNPYVKRNPREIDFYAKSSIQQNDGDPIDLNAANNKVSKFSKALSTPQGIVLFADGQQSILTSTQNGSITPSNAQFNNLSVYECDPNVKAVAMNQQFFFMDQTLKSAKLHRLLPFNQNSPQVDDLTKDVQDWCPNNIDTISVCQAAGMIMLSRRDKRQVYIYRTKGEYSSWFRWRLPHFPLHIFCKHDEIYYIMKAGNNRIDVARSDLFLYPNSEVIDDHANPDGQAINPYLDLYQVPNSNDVSATASKVTITLPTNYPLISNGQLCIVTAAVDLTPSALFTVSQLSAGYARDARIEDGKLVADGNFVGDESRIIYGYKFDLDVELPTFYYQSQQGADYTAYLTIARVKFALALSGDFQFMTQAKGQTDWTNVEAFTAADYYLADTAPMEFERIVQLPIHQRNTNFRMRFTSDSPFPLALDSCMWEGNYSPRYYRRV